MRAIEDAAEIDAHKLDPGAIRMKNGSGRAIGETEHGLEGIVCGAELVQLAHGGRLGGLDPSPDAVAGVDETLDGIGEGDGAVLGAE